MTLAIDTYRGFDPSGDDDAALQLAWTLDERELLAADLDALLHDCLHDELTGRSASLERYMVTDPHGAGTLGPAVERHFGVPGLAAHLTCGAGVNGLLHALAALGRGATVGVADDVYPDFPHWLALAGALVQPLRADGPPPGARLLFLERPAFVGAGCNELAALRALCAAMADDGVVLVDESNANYCPPSFSALALTTEVPNLVVLRGLSKAYGLGSLRVGYAVSSAPLTARIRACVPGLQVSSFSLAVAARVLALGDVAAPLRARIAQRRTALRALLAPWRGDVGVPAGEGLPYLLFDRVPAALASTAAGRRVVTKRHVLWAAGRQGHTVHRCSVPLRDERWDRLVRIVASATGGLHGTGGTMSPAP
jgi:histidinol-phosphate/aromatic aminotransferase/cobyric acid decarboxylase-like protein